MGLLSEGCQGILGVQGGGFGARAVIGSCVKARQDNVSGSDGGRMRPSQVADSTPLLNSGGWDRCSLSPRCKFEGHLLGISSQNNRSSLTSKERRAPDMQAPPL